MDNGKVIVCRCEDITLEEIRSAIKEGYTSWDELKRLLRVGMGPCGGKTCRLLVLRELAQVNGRHLDEVKTRSTIVRPPIRATPLDALTKEEE